MTTFILVVIGGVGGFLLGGAVAYWLISRALMEMPR